MSLTEQAEPEIDELEFAMAVQEDVLGFDVAMHDAFGVQVRDRHQDYLEELLGLLLFQSVLWLGQQVFVEGVCSSVFHNQVDLRTCLDRLDYPSDSRMG